MNRRKRRSPLVGTELQRLEAQIVPEPNSGCWLWDGCYFPTGYGMFVGRGFREGAHRAAYRLLAGEIPAGLVLDHLCRNPACVNPAHLEPVEQRANIARGRLSEVNTKAVCVRGHDLAANAQWRRDGWRFCGACARERAREHYQAKRMCA
jgi:hypothetical protein